MAEAEPAATPVSSGPNAQATPVRTALSLLKPVLVVLLLLALALGGASAVIHWLLVVESGSRWLLLHLPLVQTQGFKGALLGDRWQADRLRIEWDGGRRWVLIEGLQADGLRWQWRPYDPAWVGLEVKTLSVRKLTVNSGPAGPRPIPMPASIAPPMQLTVARAQVAELLIDRLAPVHGLKLSGLTLDGRKDAEHRIERLAFEAAGVAVAGSLRIGTSAPLAVTAQATLQPALGGDAPRWAAVLGAGGNVGRLQLDGTLRGVPQPAPAARKGPAVAVRAAPALDIHATLQPLQAWPLAALSVQTQALDLAALSASAPETRLSGQAELSGGDKNTPLAVKADLDNALPGRWNEHRLPLRHLVLEAQGELARPDRLALTRFDLTLADATQSAGRWTGSALWQGPELTLDTRLAAVAPQRLDDRAAAMTLTGPVLVTLRGLPAPDFWSGKAAAATAPSVHWKLDLQGQLDNKPQAVQLQIEGDADDAHLQLTRAHAQSGAASADMRATISRAGRAWKLESSGKVQDFDPLPWWSGNAGTSWRAGPHRLSGDWQFDVRLPEDADRLPPLELAQRLAGNGRLSVHDSVLAGVPVGAEITLGYTQAAAPAAGSLHADLRLGGNQILVEGRGDPAGAGEADRWRVELKAEALAALAPLAKLDPALADWVPRAGTATAVVAAEGRWPVLRTDGQARLTQLQIGRLTLARGSASWRMETGGDQALSLQLDLAGAQLGEQRADNLHAELKGTLADHHIELSGAFPLAPPPMAEQVLGIQAQSGTRAQLRAQGGWTAEAAGGGRWKARIEQLLVGSWDGSADNVPPASGWAESRDLRAELLFGRGGRLLSIQADPGRVRLANTTTLRWDEVRIDLQGEQPQIELHADIEPFALAPLLARAQPGMGWQGDLKLAARVDIRAAEKVDIDLVFERRDGDLHVASDEGVQLFGLSEFKLALAAHGGVWDFTQTFRGRSLGEISGQVRAQTTPERRWPQPTAPISGQIQARVADIGIWGAWVPPGWRLAGELRTLASIAGTFGEPQYTGEVTGTGLGVRNLLQGVTVSDGQIAVKLAGTTAQVERFSLKGGDGTLNVTGGATFGSAPAARLQIQADHFKILGRIDRQLIASGQAELSFSREQTKLEGKFTVDEGLFDTSRGDAPSLDDDVGVRRAGSPDPAQADAGAPRLRRDFVLGVDVDMGDKLRVRGRGLDTTLRGQVRLSTPGGRLAVNGTIRTEGGTYAAYGQKLDIERGILAFSGGADNPRLDVLALRPNIDTRVGVAISGNLLTPRVRLFSEPDMSDTDKLAWLVLGRAPDGLGRNDTALLQRAAVALLAGEGEAPTDALLKSLGIDELSVRQGDTDVRETVISLGKQLSRRWYVGYERGVNATTGTWQLIYRIAQRFTLRAQSGLDNSLDVIWTWRLQETPTDAAVRKSTITPP